MNYIEWEKVMKSEDGEFVYFSNEEKKEQYRAYRQRRRLEHYEKLLKITKHSVKRNRIKKHIKLINDNWI